MVVRVRWAFAARPERTSGAFFAAWFVMLCVALLVGVMVRNGTVSGLVDLFLIAVFALSLLLAVPLIAFASRTSRYGRVGFSVIFSSFGALWVRQALWARLLMAVDCLLAVATIPLSRPFGSASAEVIGDGGAHGRHAGGLTSAQHREVLSLLPLMFVCFALATVGFVVLAARALGPREPES